MSIFNSIKLRKPKRTPHNLSYSSQLSTRFGDLTPMYLEKVVPGDKFKHSHEYLMRFAPFRNQVFQNFQVRTEYFFVPSRVMWENFNEFLSSAGNQTESLFVHPYFDLSWLYNKALALEADLNSSLFDYLGIPTDVIDPTELGGDETKLHVDALPIYAYIYTFLTYYADENFEYADLVQNIDQHFHVEDGDCTENILYLLGVIHGYAGSWYGNPDKETFEACLQPFIRSYPKDYFTSALPFAQRGPVVQIPINGAGDVEVFVQGPAGRSSYQGVGVKFDGSLSEGELNATLYRYGNMAVNAGNPSNNYMRVDNQTTGANRVLVPTSSNNADVATALNEAAGAVGGDAANAITFKAVNVNGTATITDLRTAITVQAWLEKNARAGVRSTEMIASHFGVPSKDYRLQRPEFIQRTKGVISIGEVFTTAADDADNFVAGMGVSTATGSERSKSWSFYCPEHGYIIGLISVFPTAAYFQGIRKQWKELDPFDYYWPEFQNIGEQPINNFELGLFDGSTPMGLFGYTPRYAHYKCHQNEIHGDFRNSLEFMVDARKFISQPSLNNDFVQIKVAKNSLNRVFNVVEPLTNHAPIYIHIFHSVKALRPMQYYGNPRIF